MRLLFLCLAASALGACRNPAPPQPVGPRWVAFDRSQPAMGTLFRVRGYAPDEASMQSGVAAAFDRLGALERALSDYDRDSELSRLSAGTRGELAQPVQVSEDLFAVLDLAAQVSGESGGAFDITVGPAVRLWRRARRQAELPDAQRIATARAAIGWEGVALDATARTAQLQRRDMRLDLGGIAKGYALDEMLGALADHGIERALIDGGGDLAASGPPPGQEGWKVTVESGYETEDETRPGLLLVQSALATSGDTERFALIEGVRYSHIVDPRTGQALTRGVGASVLAPTGALADAWASALCVLGARDGLRVLQGARSGRQLEARVEENGEGGRIVRESVGWTQRILRLPQHQLAPDPDR